MGGYGMEENFELLEGYQFNLSDFALFLSVMKTRTLKDSIFLSFLHIKSKV